MKYKYVIPAVLLSLGMVLPVSANKIKNVFVVDELTVEVEMADPLTKEGRGCRPSGSPEERWIPLQHLPHCGEWTGCGPHLSDFLPQTETENIQILWRKRAGGQVSRSIWKLFLIS